MKEILKKYLSRNYNKKVVVLTIFASVLVALLNITGPLIYGRLISQTGAIGLRQWVLWIGIWAVISIIAIYIERYITIKKNDIATNCDIDINIDQFDHKNKLPLRYHIKNDVGEINNKIRKGGFYLNFAISDVFFALLPDILTLIAISIILSRLINYEFSFIIFMIMILYLYITVRAAKSLSENEKEVRDKDKKIEGYMHAVGMNILAVKSFCLESVVAQRLREFSDNFKKAYGMYIRSWADAEFYQKCILSLGLISLLSFAGYLLGRNDITNGDLAMVMAYTTLIFKPFVSLSGYYLMIKRAEVSIKESKQLLEEKTEAYATGAMVDGKDDRIEIRNVSFSHLGINSAIKGERDNESLEAKAEETIENVNFDFPSGPGLFGIIGQSGSGKTTLMKLIVNYFPSTKGKILYGGQDIKDIDILSLRKSIIFSGVTPLFDVTIGENIKMGVGDSFGNITDIEVMEAAKAAGVHDDIIRRGGYNQDVGNLGEEISEGEKQRIKIARTFVNKNSRVVIYDEPTIGLDPKSIDIIKKTFENLGQYKKVIVITHDINFVENAKEVIAMKSGRIIERGTLKELLELGGTGAELYKLQNKTNNLKQ